MFRATIEDSSNTKFLFGVAEVIKKIVNEPSMIISEQGIRICGLCRSHIQFIDLTLPASFFDKYECFQEQTFPMDSEEFHRALRLRRMNDTIVIEDYGKRSILVKLIDRAERSVIVHKAEHEYEVPEPPELEYKGKMVVDWKTLKESTFDLKKFSDKFVVTARPGKLELEANKSKITMHGASRFDEPMFRSAFSLQPVIDAIYTLKETPEVILSVGNDMPFKTETCHNGANFYVLTAPRIDESGEMDGLLFDSRVPYTERETPISYEFEGINGHLLTMLMGQIDGVSVIV